MSLHVDGLNLLILLNPWLQLKSAICNKYHFQGYTFKLTELVPTSHYSRRSTLSSDRLQLLSVIISKYKMDTYVNSFFPNTARHFWFMVPIAPALLSIGTCIFVLFLITFTVNFWLTVKSKLSLQVGRRHLPKIIWLMGKQDFRISLGG